MEIREAFEGEVRCGGRFERGRMEAHVAAGGYMGAGVSCGPVDGRLY